jgi:hypothetical protein
MGYTGKRNNIKFVLAQQQYKKRHRKVLIINAKIIFET